LLAFSRREATHPTILDLNALVADLREMLGRLLGEQVEILTILEDPLGRVRADAGQIEHVLVNLALNARDALPGGGTIVIRTTNVLLDGSTAPLFPELRPGPHVALSVTDNGMGMDHATRERVFEPFFTTKGPGKGTGLGLATAHGVVRQSNGAIRVESELGRGTTVTIYLPQTYDSLFPVPTAKDSAAPPLAPATILVVEDEASVRDLTSYVLRSAGYQVLEASGGEEAVQHCERYPGSIALLLSDVVMPRVIASELTDRLKSLRPRMRVMFMSGYPDDEVVRNGVQEATVAFLQKPFTPSELLQQVHDLLEEASNEQISAEL
jgi:CheY-like chemotaxis protein